MRRYELMLVIRPDVADDKSQAVIDRTTRQIVASGGQIVKVAPWGRRRLAYAIDRHREGSYHIVLFDAPGEAVLELERALLITEEVLRHLVTRVEQEIAADRVTVDIAAVGSPPWVFERANKGDALEYESPQYQFYQQAIANGLGKKGFFAFNGAYLFVPMWDAGRTNFTGKSWNDVIGAVPAGRITVGDVSKSVAYLATYAGQKTILPQEYFKKLAAMKPSFLVRSEQIAGRVVSGEDLMSFTGMPTRAYQYNQKGAQLKFILPQEGVVLLPQDMFILKKAPHPNAAKLWIDFILSETGQAVLVKGEALVSGRAGFKSPLPEYAPAIDTLNVIKIDWEKLSTQELEKLRSEWTAIFNP